MLYKGSSMTETDVRATFNLIEKTAQNIACEGGAINIPLFNTSFSISGVSDGPLAAFDPNRHKLNINITKGRLLGALEKEVTFEKANVLAPQSQVQEVKDTVTGKVNEVLHPSGAIEVRGYNIKVAGSVPAVGLWFVNELGTEVIADIFTENKPSPLISNSCLS